MQHQPLPPLFVASPVLPAVMLGVDQALLLAVIRHIDASHHAACAASESAGNSGDDAGQQRAIADMIRLLFVLDLCYELYRSTDQLRAN